MSQHRSNVRWCSAEIKWSFRRGWYFNLPLVTAMLKVRWNWPREVKSFVSFNYIGFTQDYNPPSPRQDWLHERLTHDAHLKIGWFSQQKDTLNSIESLANLAWAHLTEYVNNSTILKYGKPAFTIINDNHQVVYKMIKNECDENDVLITDWNDVWETDEMKLLVNSTRLATKRLPFWNRSLTSYGVGKVSGIL